MGIRSATAGTWLTVVTCCALLATPAHAAPIEVVANNANAGPGSLRDAIAAVDPGGMVTIPGSIGEITLTTGPITIQKSLTIDGAGAGTTSVSGGDASQILLVDENSAAVTLSDLTLRDGLADDPTGGGAIFVDGVATLTLNNVTLTENVADVDSSSSSNSGGGALYLQSGTTTLNGTTVSNNTATVSTSTGCCEGGGGIHNTGGTLTVNGGTFSGNTFTLTGPTDSTGDECCSGGGAIYQNVNAATTINNATLTGNTATINGESCCHGGGAVFHGSQTTGMTITNSTLSNNSATINGQPAPVVNDNRCCSGGGAIMSFSTTSIQGSSLTGNTATVSSGNCCHGGGAILSDQDDPATFGATTFSGNTASVTSSGCCSGGGAMIVHGDLPPLITGSLFSANQANFAGGATNSGGGAVHADHSGALAVVNSTFSGNSTSGAQGGGAIYLDGDSIGAPNLFANVTVASNSAPASNAGGLYLDDPLSLRNSIVAANTAAGAADCFGPDPATSQGHNLGVTGSTCNLTATGDQQVAATALGLAPLAANGGPTQTRALESTSPAIGGGNPGGCTDQANAALTTDQRGQPRPSPSGSSCDIGAFESPLATPQGPPVNPPVTPPSNVFTFGKLKLNKKKGTATLAVTVPGPGELALGGKDIKPQRPLESARRSTKPVAAAGETTLTVKPKGKAKKKLKKKGKAKLKATVTFTPTGGSPNAQDKTIKLKRKRK